LNHVIGGYKLKKDINFLNKKLENSLKNMTEIGIEKIFSGIEIKLFTITYSLRKLMDTHRFPDSVSIKKIKIKKYKRNKGRFSPVEMFDKCYDLASGGNNEYLLLREICNQFTHANHFQPICNQKGNIKNLFFVSDRDVNKYLYSLNIKYFLKEILKIIDKDSKEIIITFDKATDKYVTVCK